MRDALIRTRTRYVALSKALVRRDGLRLPSGEPAHTDTKLAALSVPPALAAELAPLPALWEPVHTQIAAADAWLAHVAASNPVVQKAERHLEAPAATGHTWPDKRRVESQKPNRNGRA